MFFYTNPFNDASISKNPQNEITLYMKCEVFFWIDSSFGQTEQAVIHYYLDSELNMTNSVDESLEIKDSMFINGTDLNEQYF
jgi:hypothetical protein